MMRIHLRTYAKGGGRASRRMRFAGLGSILAVALGLGFAGSRLTASAALTACSSTNQDNCIFANFELDGNTIVDGSNLDWQSSTVFSSAQYTPFYDLFNTTADNMMSNGSKESDQTTWSCVNSKPPGKSDLGGPFYTATTPTGPGTTAGEFAPKNGVPWAGSIWFETVNSKQYLFGNFQRFATNGDVHLDYEFNRNKQTMTCGTGAAAVTLPVREKGDVLITFDTSNGGAQIFVSAFVWNCPTNSSASDPKACTGAGSFAPGGNLSAGVTFSGVANISPASSDSGVTAGAFGEAGLNLTDTIGNFVCHEFGAAWMKTRSAGTSDIANGQAEVKDIIAPVSFNPGGCPNSTVSKAQADETTQNSDATAGTTEGTTGDNTADAALTYTQDTALHPLAVNPGDELVYRLEYQNTGGGDATNVVVTDSIPTGTAFVASSCNPACTTTGTPVSQVSFSLGTESAGADVFLYFEVTVNATSTTSGTKTIENFAHVAATGETGSDSNHVFAQVSYAPASQLTKLEADVQPLNLYCNTASGGAATSNASCASLPGTLNTSPTFVAGPISVTPGDVLEYQLTYTNQSSATSPATGVVISDNIPRNATYVAGSAAGADSPTIACFNGAVSVSCTSSSATVTSITWTYASVAIGASEAVTFQVAANTTFPGSASTACTTGFTANQIGNCASVVTDQDTAASLNVIANVTATPQLGLIKSASVSNGQITYTITFFNTGNQDITNQTISDVIPSGLKFVSCNPACSGGTVGQGGTISWQVHAAAGTTPSNPAGTLTLVLSQ